MDSSFVIYSISFIAVVAIIFLKMNRQMSGLLEAKQKSVRDAMHTASYLHNLSMNALYEVSQKITQIDQDISAIKGKGQEKIQALLEADKVFKDTLCAQLESELSEHLVYIKAEFLQDIKEELAEEIVKRIQKKLMSKKFSQTPAQQFVEQMRFVECG